ncbi:hypothetical protein WMF18_35510 [Sorangium sp. So ce315]|uniref:hypothetical protein n=1 Tax=Sorangium sp. So ce315 TaxID=3133299 RepID=UPI003F5E5B3D
MSYHRARLFRGLAALSIAVASACGSSDSASSDDSSYDPGGPWGGGEESSGTGNGASFVSSGAGGASGGDDGAGGAAAVEEDVNIPAPAGAPDPYTRFAHLCGEGCTPGGNPSECSSPDGSSGTGTPAQVLHCQLALVDGDAIPSCRPAGRFGAGGPCHRGTDCASGLGCAAVDAEGGVCRQYCCGNVESCAPGTYCDERPMAESVIEGSPPVSIPVCVPAVNCELLNDSACPADQTCTIVREDGTTSCVVPGAGRADEPCPCAPGFVCSMLTNQCKQLCRIEESARDCGTGAKCQGGSRAYPPGFGVCVSAR